MADGVPAVVPCKIHDQLGGGIFCVNECGLDKTGVCNEKRNAPIEDVRNAFARFNEWKKTHPGTAEVER